MQATPPIDRALTKSDVAQYFGITTRCLEGWMKRGLIPYVKIGKLVRFSLPEVQQAINDKCGRNRANAEVVR